MFSARFKELRLKRKFNQKDIAEKLNISVSTVGMYEQARRDPDTQTLSEIANFFDCSVDYLLGRTDNVKPIETMSSEEHKLIEEYRELTDFEKGNIKGRIELFIDLRNK